LLVAVAVVAEPLQVLYLVAVAEPVAEPVVQEHTVAQEQVAAQVQQAPTEQCQLLGQAAEAADAYCLELAVLVCWRQLALMYQTR
jgi:hypothetical protein